MEQYGTGIERGTVVEKQGSTYKMTSLDREGIRTPFLPILRDPPWWQDCSNPYCGQPCKEREKLEVGDRVCFVLFPDGTGFILRKMPEPE